MESQEKPAAELTKEERIEAHFTTANDHWNEYTFKIYTSVVESGLFEDVEVPLDAFSYATNLLWNGRNSPLSAVKALMSTFDEQTDPPFTDEHKRFMLDQLIWYYKNTVFTAPDKKEYNLERVAKLLRQEKDKLPEPDEKNIIRYDWQTTESQLNTLPDVKAKIAYLIDQKAKYKQSFGGLRIKGFGPDYDEQCQTEIKRLKDLAELEQKAQFAKSPFKLSSKNGAKANIIRLLNALYELHLIELNNGQRPTKEQFMQQVGGFIGVDAESYSKDLEQALNQSLEANVKVFDELKNKITELVLAKQNGSRK